MIDESVKFLVVEDNELDMEKISRSFRRLEIMNEIVRAENGIEGLDYLRGTNGKVRLEAPCVILLDLNMPRMNGFEFLQELRSDPSIAFMPVYVLTTSDRQQDIDAAHDLNVSGYIVKPVSISSMLDALAKLDAYWTLCQNPSARDALGQPSVG